MLSLKNESFVTAVELLNLSRSVNELVTACGVALQLQASVVNEQKLPQPVEGQNDAGLQAKTSRKLAVTAVALAEAASALSTHIGTLVGVPPRQDPRH